MSGQGLRRSSMVSSLGIVLAFVLFTLLWIVITNGTLGWMVKDPDLLLRLINVKSYLYVLVAAGMLFWLVYAALEARGGPAPAGGHSAPKATKAWILILLLACAALVAEGLGYAAYRFQGAAMERAGHEQLAYVAGEKAARIEAWLQERIGDAQVTAQDPLLMDRLRALRPGSRPGPGLRAELDQRLWTLLRAYRYASVHLLANGGGPLAATDSAALQPWELQGVAQARTWVVPRFIWEVHGRAGQDPQLRMACVVPILDGSPERPLGTLLFRLDPGAVLGDLLGSWPTSSPSGETLLLAREGDEALFLNRTRRPGAPVLRESLASRHLVGVRALLAGDGLNTGVDYRGVPSVAASHRLTGLPWLLLAKVDRDEFLLPMRRLVWTYAGLGVLFLVVTAAFLVAWYNRERARQGAELGRLAAEGRARGQQLELLSHYGNDIVLVLDETGRVLEANDRAVVSYQLGREQLCCGNINDLRAPEARGDYLEQFDQVKHNGAIRFKTLHQRRDGSRFPVEVSSMAFQLDGRPLVQSIIRDVTEQREHEAKIQALNDQLEQRVMERTAQLETALREMEAFSYSVSHDLRAPLRGIDGFGHALLTEYGDRLDSQGHHYLERIRNGAQRMGRIMDDLLDLSRLSRHDLTRDVVDLSAQARQILEGLEQQASGRRVALAIQDGLRVQADPRLMQMVLGQLLTNAWKFTGKREEARIEFGAAPSEAGSTFFVRDNGAGFDMAYAGKLFTAFERLHDAVEYPGTGVGLAIAQRILLRHGGRIWAEAAVEQGATFFFNLPT